MFKKNNVFLQITLLLTCLLFQMNGVVLAQSDDEIFTEAVNQSGLSSDKKKYLLLDESREHFLRYLHQLRGSQPEETINVRELTQAFIGFYAVYPHPNRAPEFTVRDFSVQRNNPPIPLVVVNPEELIRLQRALTENQNTIAFLLQQIASTQRHDQSIINVLNYNLVEERSRAETRQVRIAQLEEQRRIESEIEEVKKEKEKKKKEKKEKEKNKKEKEKNKKDKEKEKIIKEAQKKAEEEKEKIKKLNQQVKNSESTIARLRQELQQRNTEQPTHTPAQQSEQRNIRESSEDLNSQQSSEISEDNNDKTIKPTTCESEPDKCQKQSEHNNQKVNKKKSKRKENSSTTSKPAEKVLPNAVKAIAATQLQASGEGSNDSDSQGSNYWQTLKSTAASLSSRGIKATKRAASRVYNTAGSLYDKSRRGMKAVIEKLNPAKRRTGRPVRKRSVRTGYSPLKALTYTAVSMGTLFLGVKGYKYMVTETDKGPAAKKETEKELFLKIIKRLNANNNLLIGQLIQEFIDSSWEKTDFPVTGIYDKSSGTMLTKKEQPNKKACSNYEYGIVGYTDQAIEPFNMSQNRIPFFPVSDDKFTTLVTNTIIYLASKAPDLMVPGNSQHIDILASSLMWCGLPTGNKSKKLHRYCLDAMIYKIKNEGVDWYNHGIHKYYWHGIDSSEQSESVLTVSPVFNLTTECKLGILSYQPRVVKPSLNSSLYVNTPLIDDNYSSTQTSTTENYEFSAPPADYYRSRINKTKPIPDSNKEQSLQELTTLSNLHKTAILKTPVSSLAERFHYLQKKLDQHSFRWQFHPSIENYGLRKKNTVFPHHNLLSVMDVIVIPLQLMLYLNRFSFTTQSPFVSYLATRVFMCLFYLYTEKPFANEKSETYLRASGLETLLNQYKFNLKDYKKYYMLFLLSLDINSPLGVISFKEDGVNQMKKMKMVDYYPLSQLETEKQKKLFDKAYLECSRHYGIECNYENQIHREYVKFYLAICSSKKHSCSESLFDSKYSTWIMISNEFDWPEINLYQHFYESPTFKFDQYAFNFALLLNEDNFSINIGIKQNLDQFKKSESSSLSIDGKYSCYPFKYENSNNCLFSTTKKQTLLTNFNNEIIFLLRQHRNDQSNVLLLFSHGTLLKGITNKKISFVEDANIKNASCSTIIYNNLRAYCSTVASSVKKRNLALIMEIKAEKNLWIPVFKKSTSNESKKTTYYFSHRIKFDELTIDQIGRHIDYITTYIEMDELSTKSIINSNILIYSLSVIGVLDDENDSMHQPVYDARYQSILGRGTHNKKFKKLTPCLNTRIQASRLCGEKDECLRLMPGWSVKAEIDDQVSDYTEEPSPVWIMHDKTLSVFSNASAVSQALSWLDNANEYKVYQYVSQLNKPDNSVPGESIEPDSEIPYILTENELQYTSKFYLRHVKGGVTHTDHCGIDIDSRW